MSMQDDQGPLYAASALRAGDPASPAQTIADIAVQAIQDLVTLYAENKLLKVYIAELEAQLAARSTPP